MRKINPSWLMADRAGLTTTVQLFRKFVHSAFDLSIGIEMSPFNHLKFGFYFDVKMFHNYNQYKRTNNASIMVNSNQLFEVGLPLIVDSTKSILSQLFLK